MLKRFVFTILLLVPMAAFAADLPRPNIVFLLADDMGWADLSCYGSQYYETPIIDQMAKDSVRFTCFYSAGSVCSPTRGSIMSGKYPPRTGVTDWIPGVKKRDAKLLTKPTLTHLPLEEFTVGEAFKAAGYQTFYTGKWHLGTKGFSPKEQGFDEYVGDTNDEEEEGSGKKDPNKLKVRLESTGHFTQATIDFLHRRNADKPFFAFVGYHDVHTPIQPMPGLVEPYEAKTAKLSGKTPSVVEHNGQARMRQDNAAYGSMMSAVDQSVGQIRNALKELKLTDNTIVIFASDNGGLSTQANIGPTCNLPLRAGKGWLYEGGIRVPLIVYAPNRMKAGLVCDQPAITTDFYPTLLSMAGLPLRPEQHLDGIDVSPLLTGGTVPARPFYWHYPHYHGSTWAPGGAIRDGDWKLVEFFEDNKVELFNLRDDLAEKNDLAEENPEKAAELREKLHQWQASVNAVMPKPNPDYKAPAPGDDAKKKAKKAKKAK